LQKKKRKNKKEKQENKRKKQQQQNTMNYFWMWLLYVKTSFPVWLLSEHIDITEKVHINLDWSTDQTNKWRINTWTGWNSACFKYFQCFDSITYKIFLAANTSCLRHMPTRATTPYDLTTSPSIIFTLTLIENGTIVSRSKTSQISPWQ
jgi:hypothetical protein